MTKEQETIERLNKLVKLRKNKAGEIKFDTCICGTEDIETVLSMLKGKDTEIEKKDKIIDLMSRAIDNYDSQLVINIFKDKKHVKEYFKELAERKSEK